MVNIILEFYHVNTTDKCLVTSQLSFPSIYIQTQITAVKSNTNLIFVSLSRCRSKVPDIQKDI